MRVYLPETAVVAWGQRLMTFTLVCVAWAFFRADSVATALSLLSRAITGWTTPTELVTPTIVLAIAVGLLTQFTPRGLSARIKAAAARMRPVPLGLSLAGVLFVVTTLGPRGVAPFIYFQF